MKNGNVRLLLGALFDSLVRVLHHLEPSKMTNGFIAVLFKKLKNTQGKASNKIKVVFIISTQ